MDAHRLSALLREELESLLDELLVELEDSGVAGVRIDHQLVVRQTSGHVEGIRRRQHPVVIAVREGHGLVHDALLAQASRHALVEVDGSLDQTTAFSDPRIASALRLMRDHPDHRWTVPKMAAEVSMSRSAFAERFRTAMGETPMQHLTRYRMARAAEYLRVTNAGIREIARLTGYDSEVSVTKAFRRQCGVAPGAYRKANAAQAG